MSLFKKSNRKFRQRRKDDDSDEEVTSNLNDNSNENNESANKLNSNLKIADESTSLQPVKVQNKSNLKLSFHDEEEGKYSIHFICLFY